MWIFGGAAAAVVAGGLLMQQFRATPGQAADGAAGTARVGGADQKNNRMSARMAMVDREVITYEAVADECVARFGREVLDDMIHRMVIAKACEKANVTVTEQEVSEEITRIAKRFKLDVTAYLQMLQSERNISPMQYRASVIWPMLALKKLAGEEVEITETDIQKAFVRNYGPRVKARVIMVDNSRRGGEVWEKAKKNPAAFEQLAQEYSIDPNSRALGGQVPPIPRYMGNDRLEEEAFKLKEGELSGLIELAQGRWVILKCDGRTTPVVTDIEEVRDSLYEELKEAKVQQAVGKVFEKIKADTRVDNYFARSSSGPEQVVPVSAQAPAGTKPGQGATPANATRPATGAAAAPRAPRN
jgi:foldase protein PrsA